jgi:glycosyltransferase involved in cell wall biosynthesis
MAGRFGFISTYPPTQCGLATFTASLLGALTSTGLSDACVARLLDAPQPPGGNEIVTDIVIGDPPGSARSADHLNECDVVIVQHEFGVYGGPDGADVLTLLATLTVPTIVVLHTVLTTPTAHQRDVLEAVVAAASAVVTMTVTARDRLAAGYRVDIGKVSIIAHGAPEPASSSSSLSAVFRNGQPTVLTWGLLGPGKGIEWGIEAMARLQDLRPVARYVIAGQTHPKVALREGEAYRASLGRLIQRHALTGSVSLDGRYRDASSLAGLVASADVVLLPYDSTDQVTSGVLIEAVAAGKPVVATRFPHAVELLSSGAGMVVSHQDPAAIADALRVVITRREVAAAMSQAAAVAAPASRWSVVAEQYRQLAIRVIADAAAVAA